MKINLLFFFTVFFLCNKKKQSNKKNNSATTNILFFYRFFFTLNLKYTLNDFDHKKTKFKVYLSFGTFCPHF